MLNFVQETDNQIEKIRQLITDAFGQTKEAALVETIRKSSNFIPELSLVAQENEDVLGHILFSSIVIETSQETFPVLALAPLSVTPLRQRQGIGSKLVEVGLIRCRELNHSIVIIVGEPRYYNRFGFQKASQFGLHSSLPIPDEVFMVLELKPSALMNVNGTVWYPTYFNEV
ncbi:GNAT family N-acetyltransferase [Nostocales cyanobacterium HT-58-2]|nr:GNAT family N-acetyltransferase [Nostocales cyanobacterium HT-58-2]